MTTITPEVYDCIYAKDTEGRRSITSPTKRALEDVYDLDAIARKFVIQRESDRAHLVFNSIQDYEQWSAAIHDDLFAVLDAPPPLRCYHEVVFPGRQKLRFDIDAPADKLRALGDPASVFSDLLADLITYAQDIFFSAYGMELYERDLIVCTSHGFTVGAAAADAHTGAQCRKYSAHVVVAQYAVSSHTQAAEFARRVVQWLSPAQREFVDMNVYKRVQYFRTVNSVKLSDPERIKMIASASADADTTLTYISALACAGLPMLPDLTSAVAQPVVDHVDVPSVLQLCERAGLLTDHKYRNNRGGVYAFNRLRPSMCEFCAEVHHNDNTLIVTTQRVGNLVHAYKNCRQFIANTAAGTRAGTSAGILIGRFTTDKCADVAPTARGCWIDYKIQHAIGALSAPGTQRDDATTQTTAAGAEGLAPAFQRLFGKAGAVNEYTDCVLKPFELCRTLLVHAGMKMGKTKALKAYLAAHFASRLRPPVIRFISFRQTFSAAIKEQFADFVLYSEVKGPLIQDKLIVQCESLHRLDIRAAPDLVIMDESESIIEQMCSQLMRANFARCVDVFCFLLRSARHVVCLDAYMSERTLRVIQQIRPPVSAVVCDRASAGNEQTPTIIYHHCARKNAADDTYYVTGDKGAWLEALLDCLASDEKIALPCSSLTAAQAIKELVARKLPDKIVKLYSSETLMSEKRDHFARVNECWTAYDLLIYTPTVTAGISFEAAHFTKMFAYFSDRSCAVETSMQMMGRIRAIADRAYYVYFDAAGDNLPESASAITAALYDNRADLFVQYYDGFSTLNVHDPDQEYLGEQYVETKYDSDYFYVWLENTRVRHRSRNRFIAHFIRTAAIYGARVEKFGGAVGSEGASADATDIASALDILREYTAADNHKRDEKYSAIAAAADLTADEAEAIHDDMAALRDVDVPAKRALEKYKLRRWYNYDGAMTAEFVEKYSKPRVKEQFRNLGRLIGCANGVSGANDSADNAQPTLTTEQCSSAGYSRACARIQAEERTLHMHLMANAPNEDVQRGYTYQRHRLCAELVTACGWTHPLDVRYLHANTLIANLERDEKAFWRTVGLAADAFAMAQPRLQKICAASLTDCMRAVGRFLNALYGVKTAASGDMWYLAQNALCMPLLRVGARAVSNARSTPTNIQGT